MPNVSTYVRTEDLSKYLEIAKEKGAWTEFIHNALNVEVISSISPSVSAVSYAYVKPVKTEQVAELPAIKRILEKNKLCKHGMDPRFCKHAKFVNGKKVCK